MVNRKGIIVFIFGLAALSVSFVASVKLYAHCDTLDGPVILDARLAIDKKDVTPVLKWVKEEDEPEIRIAFERALSKREADQKEADMEFFETLVRIHRAGEGAEFSGLKPIGAVEPAVSRADKAIEANSVDELAVELTSTLNSGIKERFDKLIEAKKHMNESVEAGRRYVAAYIEYVHYVEKIYEALGRASEHSMEKESHHKH
ncbi:MAG: hypothetical protein C4533_04655 [Candidatus Omnitrophota bacterium]|jgi:hypothetical protein|nr:MAG: hypothetical protein C4533_04655 [Candidatus Omnitrophota bacterium]